MQDGNEVRTKLYTSEDCVQDSGSQDWNDKILVISPRCLSPDYRTPEFQLWRGDGGFGCSPTATGSAVFAVCLADDERARWSRNNFLGILKPELVEQHKRSHKAKAGLLV